MWTSIWIFLCGLAVALIAPMVAHAIKLAEFRQAWINEIRKDIAEYLGLARKWARGYEAYETLVAQDAAESDIAAKQDEVASVLTEARVIMWRIQMRINPVENKHKAQDAIFLSALSAVTDLKVVKPEEPDAAGRWHDLAQTLVDQSRALLKREWEVTKQPPPKWFFDALSWGKRKLVRDR